MGRQLYMSRITLCALCLVLSICLSCKNTHQPQDLIVVLDTSLSMTGHGGKNILPQVKESLNSFIDKMQSGDTFTFISFDSVVRVYPAVSVNDQNDRDILKKYISMVEANGPWTYTLEMLKAVLKSASDLEAKDPKRQRVIIILTDGLDDPPPEVRLRQLSIKSISQPYQGKDWFIYFVNLGALKDSKVMEPIRHELAGSVSPYTKVIDSNHGPKQTIEEDLNKDVNAMQSAKYERERRFYTRPWFAGCVVLFLLFMCGIYVIRMSRLRLFGDLEYYDMTSPLYAREISCFNLAEKKVRTAFVGRQSNHFKIRDLSDAASFTLVAVYIGGKCVVTVKPSKTVPILYLSNAAEGYLSDRDEFTVGNFQFRYISKTEN